MALEVNKIAFSIRLLKQGFRETVNRKKCLIIKHYSDPRDHMTKEAYLKQLFDDVNSTNAGIETGGQREAFLDLSCKLLEEAGALTEMVQCVDEIKNNKIPYHVDAYSVPSENAAVLDLVYVIWSDSQVVTDLSKKESDDAYTKLTNFFEKASFPTFVGNLENGYSKDAAEKINYNIQNNMVSRVRYIIITNKSAKKTNKKKPTMQDNGICYEYLIYDLEMLRRFDSGAHIKNTIDVDFSDENDQGLPCISVEAGHKENTSIDVYLGVISGDKLAEIYKSYGQRLMESNIRAYLQGKGKINKGIIETIKRNPDKFIAFNNGICCTVKELEITGSGNQKYIKAVTDLQIVNGGQTTASLFFASANNENTKKNLSTVKVPFKIIKISEDADGDEEHSIENMVHSISKYSNSQNKISEVDLASNSPLNIALEKISRTVVAPSGTKWYYERAKGSYLTDINAYITKKDKENFKNQNPLIQKFDKNIWGKIENIWRLAPFVVSKGAQSSYLELVKYFTKNKPLMDEKYFKDLVSKIIIYNSFVAAIKKNGRSGNITLPACYMFAWLINYTEYRINLDSIWINQSVTPVLDKRIQDMVHEAYEFLMELIEGKNPLSAFSKVTTWQDFCSKDFLNIKLGDDKELLSELLTSRPSEIFRLENAAIEVIWNNLRSVITGDQTIRDVEAELDRKWVARNFDHNQQVKDILKLEWSDFHSTLGLTENQKVKLVYLLRDYTEK